MANTRTPVVRIIIAGVVVLALLGGVVVGVVKLAGWAGRASADKSASTPSPPTQSATSNPTVTQSPAGGLATPSPSMVAPSGPLPTWITADDEAPKQGPLFNPDDLPWKTAQPAPEGDGAVTACKALEAFYTMNQSAGPVTWTERVERAEPYLSPYLAWKLRTGKVPAMPESTMIWEEIATSTQANCVQYTTDQPLVGPNGDRAVRSQVGIQVTVTGEVPGEWWRELYSYERTAVARLNTSGDYDPNGQWRVVSLANLPVSPGFDWTVNPDETWPFHPPR